MSKKKRHVMSGTGRSLPPASRANVSDGHPEGADSLKKRLEAAMDAYKVLTSVLGREDDEIYNKYVLPLLFEYENSEECKRSEEAGPSAPQPTYRFYLDYSQSRVYMDADAEWGGRVLSLANWVEGAPPEAFLEDWAGDDLLDLICEYFTYDGQKMLYCSGTEENAIYRILTEGVEELKKRGEVYASDEFRRLTVRKSFHVQVGIGLDAGLLHLSLTSSDLSEEELMQILESVQKKKHFHRLKDGSLISIDDNETIKALQQALQESGLSIEDFVRGHMEVPAYRALYIAAKTEERDGVSFDLDERTRKMRNSLRAFRNTTYPLPNGLQADLFPYQEEGYRWLRTLDEWEFSGILADDMGLGKTLQVIACIDGIHEGTSLIVCPSSLVDNWAAEIRKFAPDLNLALLSGSPSERINIISNIKKYDVAVTSYDLIKRDIAEYEDHTFRIVVADEAQYIKNPASATAKTVKLLQARTRFALTGTPIENRLSELWSIFDFLMPRYLHSYARFHAEFEAPIVRGRDQAAAGRLNRMITPFLLRRKKEDVLTELPDKLEQTVRARMESGQRRLYDAEVTKLRQMLARAGKVFSPQERISCLSELTRLRQICCDPSLIADNFKGKSAKTELCLQYVRALTGDGHRILIFSQFTSMLEILGQRLKQEGIPFLMLTGSTPQKDRIGLVNDFNAGAAPVFLISLKAGGTGLTLTGADVVIHFDPWWNMAARSQATDRAYRIGQTKNVTEICLLAAGTVEEKILALQEQKSLLAEGVLGGAAAASAVFDPKELLQLLN